MREDDLREALAKHAECWNDGALDLSIAAAEVCRRVTMGSEATAVDRIDAVHSRLEQFFLNPSAERVFRDTLGANEVPQPSLVKQWWLGCNPPSSSLRLSISSK